MEETLASRIVAAGLDLGGKMKPDGYNKEQGYPYISTDQALLRCGQALYQHGVTVMPGVIDSTIQSVERPSKAPRYDAMVTMTFVITDGKEREVLSWVGAGSDYAVPDKAVYKAITSGHKYFLLKLLNIGEGNEDGEHEGEPKEQKRQQAARQPAQPQAIASKPSPAPANPPAAPDKAPANDAPAGKLWQNKNVSLNIAKSQKLPGGLLCWEALTKDLVTRANEITKLVKANGLNQQQHTELQLEQDVIAAILNYRN